MLRNSVVVFFSSLVRIWNLLEKIFSICDSKLRPIVWIEEDPVLREGCIEGHEAHRIEAFLKRCRVLYGVYLRSVTIDTDSVHV